MRVALYRENVVIHKKDRLSCLWKRMFLSKICVKEKSQDALLLCASYLYHFNSSWLNIANRCDFLYMWYLTVCKTLLVLNPAVFI